LYISSLLVREVIVRRDRRERVVLESSFIFIRAAAQVRVREWRIRPLQPLVRDTQRVNITNS